MKLNKSGFTLVELLTVLAVIVILMGILLPAVNMVRTIARETKQKVQLTTIELALTAFKNDYGDYPPSDYTGTAPDGYCGAQKLAEALLGWDLLGFHPDSAWRSDGLDDTDGEWTYDPAQARGDETLNERRGPYLELATADVYRLGNDPPLTAENGLFDSTQAAGYNELDPNTYVLCDVFSVRRIFDGGKAVKAGTPILYYRANTASKTIEDTTVTYDKWIYNVEDNDDLVALNSLTVDGSLGREHPLGVDISNYENFYNYITDQKIKSGTGRIWPVRPDSYLLITAGKDGLYGTSDDICNF